MTGRVRFALLTTLLVVGLTSPALAQKPVKIGVLTPLSPPGDAAAGQFIVRGAKMGADDVNARDTSLRSCVWYGGSKATRPANRRCPGSGRAPGSARELLKLS